MSPATTPDAGLRGSLPRRGSRRLFLQPASDVARRGGNCGSLMVRNIDFTVSGCVKRRGLSSFYGFIALLPGSSKLWTVEKVLNFKFKIKYQNK